MTYSLTWLPEVLEKEGLKVAEVPGWRTRGRAEMGTVTGVICHHTGTAAPGNMPTLNMLIKGRPDLSGPLCQLGLGRDGTFYIVAAGRANHAGTGEWAGKKDAGNAHFIGIEAEHSGKPSDPWPDVQKEAYARGIAAILRHIDAGASMCCGHKEYAPKRKVDPTFDMAEFRGTIGQFLVGKTPPPPIAATDDKHRPTLRRGARGADVIALQDALGIDSDGNFGAGTEAALRARQRTLHLVPDGICGPNTWAVLLGEKEPPAPPAAAPEPPLPAPAGQARAISAKGLALIKSFEGCEDRLADGRFQAYPDPGSRDGKPWTIGWGSTGGDIQPGTIWSQQQCDDRFASEMGSYADAVSRAIGDAATTQDQFDALVSFHYNTGAIGSATLTTMHKAGRYPEAAEQFGRWIYNNHKVMNGLVRRRRAEAALYQGTWTPPA